MRWSLIVIIALSGCRNFNPNTAPDRNTHARYFPIASGNHAVDCNTCHGAFDTFTRFDCLTGCHTNPETDNNHAGMTGYRYDSAACYHCHPRGIADSAVDHFKFFPIDAGDQHAAVACNSCHIDPANRDNVGCAKAGCHDQSATDPAHALVGGYQYVSSQCLLCHADSQVDRVASHAPFRISSGAHARQSCLVCHPSRRTDKPFGEDFTPFTCISRCHSQSETDQRHAAIAGYGSDPPTCLACHKNGSAG